jgi:hypothetical protein
MGPVARIFEFMHESWAGLREFLDRVPKIYFEHTPDLLTRTMNQNIGLTITPIPALPTYSRADLILVRAHSFNFVQPRHQFVQDSQFSRRPSINSCITHIKSRGLGLSSCTLPKNRATQAGVRAPFPEFVQPGQSFAHPFRNSRKPCRRSCNFLENHAAQAGVRAPLPKTRAVPPFLVVSSI